MATKASTKTTKPRTSRKNADNNQNEDFSRMSIEEQTANFLKKGGEIQQIPLGVSGQVATSGPRHITLGKRHAAS